MIADARVAKRSTVQNIISRALITSLVGVFIIAFITASLLSYKSSQEEQKRNKEKIHEVMANLIMPSLVISDTTEIRRLLSLVTTPEEFFGVISKEGSLFLHDYNQMAVVNSLTSPVKNITDCKQIQGKMIKLNNKKYTVYCTPLLLSDVAYGSNKVNQDLGILVSFYNDRPIFFTNAIFLYFIGIAFATLLLMVICLRIILQKKILRPLASLKNKITYKISHSVNGQAELGNIGLAPYDILEIKNAFDDLLKNFQDEVIKRNESERKSALYDLAAQVAHDIRSPLVALDIAAKSTSGIPEDRRLVIRNATQRINDIANNLLQEYKEKCTDSAILAEYASPSLGLLMSMLDTIISEKRAQYSNHPIQFDFEIESGAHGVFVKVNSIEFKRIISNLINNAVEAITGNGLITISLSQYSEYAVIKITDNGCGIPQAVLSQLFSPDITFGKQDGHGLGLYHAHTAIQSWNGSIKMTSEVDKGAAVSIFLPRVESPSWFVNTITFKRCDTIIVFDDDASIHQVWSKRFSEFNHADGNIEIKHFVSGDQLREWILQSPDHIQHCIFLMDYEILSTEESGLDLIEHLELQRRAVLVTSRYEEKSVIDRCRHLNVGLLPKSISPFVPIQLISDDYYDAILIDDDLLVRQAWEISALMHDKKIKTFSAPEHFISFSKQLDIATVIYIDSKLGNDCAGEKIAKEVYAQGFKNIYLATGSEASQFKGLPYLCGVISKVPPWESQPVKYRKEEATI